MSAASRLVQINPQIGPPCLSQNFAAAEAAVKIISMECALPGVGGDRRGRRAAVRVVAAVRAVRVTKDRWCVLLVREEGRLTSV